ncbi:cobalt ABC transporter ATPase [Thioclava dalianensis]|uniref:Cobalt ABC transporter ATPase n=1 Tax=Thioclava dalianensis TaxID=1185766 RepID=A0A074TGB4_9RHOB|nr:ABC transporter ATP-binding protein [Thioclava dalianensis]KEP68103.1 cobalt ABC transporter ATPase [Thioclava dalianensis]SFN39172.1 cobalt/nickel transport system ATP-binding protein [Thioclava dalianensis]
MALLDLQDIDFAYAGQPPVLRGASLQMRAGERLAISGDNGAGKSTLLRLIVGLLRPTRGTVTAFGRPRLHERDFHEVRRRAGYVFQDPDDQLFCPTVAEDIAFGPLNLGLGRAQASEIVTRVLDQLGIAPLRARITHHLSGGEKRLVSLACVLAMEPDILLLDEPTNALDTTNVERLTEILQGLPQAIVLVTHDPQFRTRIAPGGLRIEDGRLIDAS